MKNTFAYLTKEQYNGIDRFQENEYGVDNKTICFIADTNEIYTHGKPFGKGGNGNGDITIDGLTIHVITDSDTNKPVIDPENLPIASTSKFGIVKVDTNGGIAVDGGVISISAAIVYNKLKQYLKNLNPQNDDDDPFILKPATDKALGGVMVPGGDGLEVSTTGVKGKLTLNMQKLWNTLSAYLTNNNIQIGGGKSKLSELDDVNTLGIQDGYVLKWDANNHRWNPAQDNAGTGGIEGGYVVSFTDPDSNGDVLFRDSNGHSVSINIYGGTSGVTGLEIDGRTVRVTTTGSSYSDELPLAGSDLIDGYTTAGVVRGYQNGMDSDYLDSDTNSISDYHEALICPLQVDNSHGDAYIMLTPSDIAALNEVDENTPVVQRATKSRFGVVRLGLDQDDNVDVDNLDLSDEDNRKYPLSMDTNGCAFVTVPWRTGVDPEYVDNAVAEAIEAAERVGETLDQYSDALNSLTEGTFAEDLAAATSAILAAQGDLDTLHAWLNGTEPYPYEDDPAFIKLHTYLDKGNNQFYSFEEKLNLDLSDSNGQLYQKVLTIVNANVPNTDGIVTTVKNQIISDGTFATQSFVGETVQTGVNGLKNQYTSGGLYIDSSGKVVLRTSDVQIDKGTSTIPQKQSFANGIYDATKGLIEQATATQIGDAVNEVGLSLNSSTGEFALVTQSGNSTLTTDGPKINITDVAGVIGSTAAAASSVWAGIMARATVNGKSAAASIIADVNKSTGNSSIYLNADRVIVGGTKNDDGTITGGEFVANKITAIEANIDTINANLITADTIVSRVNGTEYLYVSTDPSNQTASNVKTSVLRPMTLLFGSKTDLDSMSQGSVDAIYRDYSNVSAWGATFYPAGVKGNLGMILDSSPTASAGTGGSLRVNSTYGILDLDGTDLTFINKNGTKIYDSTTWGYDDILSHPYMTLGLDANHNAEARIALYSGNGTARPSTIIKTNSISLSGSGTDTCDITSAGPVTSSDIRYKNIIDDIHLDTADIAAAPKFTYTSQGDTSGKVMFGTSAQYWRNLIPQSVVENEEGKLAMYYDKTALIAAISVAEEVVALKNEIAELKQQIAALTSNN